MIAGTELNASAADMNYCCDIGLVKKDPAGNYVISNLLYQEVIPRELLNIPKLNTALSQLHPLAFLDNDGKIRMDFLMEKWIQFYLENIESWTEIQDYKEAGVHLLLFAFLQRIVNGGGRLHREYALGKKECDIIIEKPYKVMCFDLS
jgi:hypothetical protein